MMKQWTTYRPVVDSDLRNASRIVSEELSQWRMHWLGTDEALRLDAEPSEASAVSVDGGGFCLPGSAALRLDASWLTSLALLALHSPHGVPAQTALGQAVVARFADRMAADLWTRLRAGFALGTGQGTNTKGGRHQAFVKVRGKHARSAHATDLAIELTVVANGRLRTAAPVHWPEPVERASAIGPSQARIDVAIRPVEAKAADIVQLKVGDVLITPHSIREPLTVQAGSADIARGFPCRVDGRRAIQFVAGSKAHG